MSLLQTVLTCVRIGIVAMGLCSSGCALLHRPGEDEERTAPGSAYSSAIMDAAVIESSEMHDLLPILSDSVTVVTWTKYPDSFRPGASIDLRFGDLWVTVEPEVREACRGFDPDNLLLRLQQFHGLPADTTRRWFAVLKAARKDIFRPCIDPDPGSIRCEDTAVPAVPEDHLAWFAGQILLSYRAGGFPWTRLGYTYDWGPGASEYGASEYVLRREARARVLDVFASEAYCSSTGAPRGR